MVKNSEADWMLGSSSLSPPSNHLVLGTSPSGVSDLSNEAQGHLSTNGNNGSSSDLGISPPSMAARYYDNASVTANHHHPSIISTTNNSSTPSQLQNSTSPHLEYPNSTNSSNVNTPQMSGSGILGDSRPSFQSQRSSFDPSSSSNPNSSFQQERNVNQSPSLADLSNQASNFTGLTTSGSGFSQITNPTTNNTSNANQDEIVPTTFDEGMLRALCDMDVSKEDTGVEGEREEGGGEGAREVRTGSYRSCSRRTAAYVSPTLDRERERGL